MKKYFKEILICILIIAICFLLFYKHQDEGNNSDVQNHSQTVERAKYVQLYEKFKAFSNRSKSSIDSLENIRQKTKIIYKEKIITIPVADTCERCKVELEFCKVDNSLLTETITYYAKALNECDTQFMILARDAEFRDSVKTSVIVQQLDELEYQRQEIDKLQSKIKTKNRKLFVLSSLFVLENGMIIGLKF